MVTELRQDCLRRQKLGPHIDEKGCLSWLTPTANEIEQDIGKFIKRMEKYPNGTTMPSLSNQVKQWRTPASSDGEGGIKAGEKYENAECPKIKLRDQVHHQKSWATPQAFDHVDIVRTPEQLAKTRAEKNAGCVNLREQVHNPEMTHSRKAWPTPTSRDHKDGTAESCQNVPSNGLLGREVHNTTGKSRGSLNANWVEQLQGLEVGWTQLPTEWID
jgi:hypothetical protein